MRDKRLVFDTIPERFDKWRGRYCPELFAYLVDTCGLTREKRCLEIGPGTGQATEFALRTGCDYCAIELGEHLAAVLRRKFGQYPNFHLIRDDFETHPFAPGQFDLIYSAAAIQWLDETIAYQKCAALLRDGGFLAMFFLLGDYQSTDPALYADIQRVYDAHFVSEHPYRRRFHYEDGERYGLRFLGKTEFHGTRRYDADAYLEFIQTHSDHILLREEHRKPFFDGIRDAILRHGNKIEFLDTFPVYLYQK